MVLGHFPGRPFWKKKLVVRDWTSGNAKIILKFADVRREAAIMSALKQMNDLWKTLDIRVSWTSKCCLSRVVVECCCCCCCRCRCRCRCRCCCCCCCCCFPAFMQWYRPFSLMLTDRWQTQLGWRESFQLLQTGQGMCWWFVCLIHPDSLKTMHLWNETSKLEKTLIKKDLEWFESFHRLKKALNSDTKHPCMKQCVCRWFDASHFVFAQACFGFKVDSQAKNKKLFGKAEMFKVKKNWLLLEASMVIKISFCFCFFIDPFGSMQGMFFQLKLFEIALGFWWQHPKKNMKPYKSVCFFRGRPYLLRITTSHPCGIFRWMDPTHVFLFDDLFGAPVNSPPVAIQTVATAMGFLNHQHPRFPPPLKQWLTQFWWLKPLGKQWWLY